MLQPNTIDRLRPIVLSICILFSASLFAQSEKNSEESTIVMTKFELNSFLSTIADARCSQLKETENRRQKQDLAALRLKYQERSGMLGPLGKETGGLDNISNQQILRELRYLNQRMDNLSSGRNVPPSMSRDNSTIIIPGSATTGPAYPSNAGSTTTFIPSNDKKIKELEDKIDSLRNVDADRASSRKENFLRIA